MTDCIELPMNEMGLVPRSPDQKQPQSNANGADSSDGNMLHARARVRRRRRTRTLPQKAARIWERADDVWAALKLEVLAFRPAAEEGSSSMARRIHAGTSSPAMTSIHGLHERCSATGSIASEPPSPLPASPVPPAPPPL
mmetsp:Transcript_40369/g.80909  ORF Transcript_40369/g.80909 Transcript_40369/m.80909 type:complete len:140 (-) Transcript_40369:408-827(-)